MRIHAIAAAGIVIGTLWCVSAHAQVPSVVPGAVPFTPNLPSGVSGPAANGMTLQQMMMLRALQGRGGRHQPHTGVPNPIINGGFGPDSMPMMGDPVSGTPSGGKARRKSAEEKRAEVRAQREEKKQSAKVAGSKTKPEKPAKKSRKNADQG